MVLVLARSAVLSALIDGSEEDFRDLVQVLPERDRELLRLHYREGQSWSRVSNELHYQQRYLKHRCAIALETVEGLLFPSFPPL